MLLLDYLKIYKTSFLGSQRQGLSTLPPLDKKVRGNGLFSSCDSTRSTTLILTKTDAQEKYWILTKSFFMLGNQRVYLMKIHDSGIWKIF